MSATTPVPSAPPTSLELGLWAPKLREQGFDLLLEPDDVDYFQQLDEAISLLHVRQLITYSQHITAREKLAKLIKAAIKQRTEKAGVAQ